MKYVKYLIAGLIFLISGVCLADDLVPYSFPFTGKWNPTENPMLLDDYGLQDIQNLRKWGKHFRGVKGHSKINTTALVSFQDNNIFTIVNGFQFRKGNPVESHIFVQTNNDNYHILRKSNNTTAVPNQDTFDANFLNLPTSNIVNFSNAPDGSMVVLDGTANWIWGGNEARCASFLNFDAVSSSFFYDFTTQVNNTAVNSSNMATLVADANGNTSLYIGSVRPLEGVNFYIQTPNTTAATAGVQQWTGTAWSSVSSLVDGTAASGKTMNATGEIMWASTTSTSQLTVINNIALYYYKITFTGMPSGVTVSFCTVDAPIQPIADIWDGSDRTIVNAMGSDFSDYTSKVLKPAYVNGDSSSYWNGITSPAYLAFSQPVRGLNIYLAVSLNVVSGSTMTVQYWNGSAWVEVSSLSDGTAGTSSISMQHSGYVMWAQPSPSTEFQTKVNNEGPFYWYRIIWPQGIASGNSGPVGVQYIGGVPCQTQIHPYRFAAMWQGRLWLFNDQTQYNNSTFYSALNTSNVFNGTDSGTLQFGDQTPVMAAAAIYNMYYMYNGLEQLIVAKENETYRVSGTKPSDWVVQRISANVGCVAPLTMVSADVTAMDNQRKQVAIWVGDKGVYTSDGATVVPISDDIRCYFNPNDVRYIPTAMRSKSVGWYDPSIKSYKLLIASGAGATTLNTELEYSLQYQEWTKISRQIGGGGATSNPLQSGWQVYDANGISYTYGGDANGFVYRLEDTNRWDGTSITSYLQTKDILPEPTAPLLHDSTIEYLQVAYLKKQTGQITIQHFGDGMATTDQINGQAGPAPISAADALGSPYNTQSVLLGPNLYHSFLFQATTNVGDGLELTGFSFYFDVHTAIR
jgi:hypothetical protein